MGHTKSFSVAPMDDDFEFDESFFRQFYKPLSNLPTPPPSTRVSSANQSPRASPDDTESHDSPFLGPAAHLARMLPPGASFITPSIPTVQQMLVRADLPMDMIALAVCILDSLDSKFSRTWRISFPLNNRQCQPTAASNKRHTLPSAPSQHMTATHINSVSPEIIILAALVVAEKFVEDMQSPTQYFVSTWADDAWTCEQLNYTERCIMESLGYRILPLWEPALIKQARHDIEMARREIIQESNSGSRCGISSEDGSARKQHFKSMSSGHAIVGLGLCLTPATTPDSERSP